PTPVAGWPSPPAGPTYPGGRPGAFGGPADPGAARRRSGVLVGALIALAVLAVAGPSLAVLLWTRGVDGTPNPPTESEITPTAPGPGAGSETASGSGTTMAGSGPATADAEVDVGPHLAGPLCPAAGGPVAVNEVVVTNQADVAMDYEASAAYEDDAGVRVADASDTVTALAPGSTAILNLTPNEPTATGCTQPTITGSPTPAADLDLAALVTVESCDLDEFFGNWYEVTFTVTNSDGADHLGSFTVVALDEAGLRLDQSQATIVDVPAGTTSREVSTVPFGFDTDRHHSTDCAIVAGDWLS
ncbi:MAG: hypothetical protein ACK5RL_04445, partial [Acidimicrobiales bacterium]